MMATIDPAAEVARLFGSAPPRAPTSAPPPALKATPQPAPKIAPRPVPAHSVAPAAPSPKPTADEIERKVLAGISKPHPRLRDLPPAPDSAEHGWRQPGPILPDEWCAARPAPDCIVEDYLYADVGLLIAPGGTGKTTLILFEAVHIVLGLPFFGLEVRKPGAFLILTAEDSREMLVARLREICEAMRLTAEQKNIVAQRVLISDVSGDGLRLTEVYEGVVMPSPVLGEIVGGCRQIAPVLVTIDPAVSFGVGESRVNDAEQGLVEAGRRLRRELNCCVRYIHHTGKANARERTTDQYSGRGGSAFADGARMVAVLQRMTADEWLKETACELAEGDTGLRLVRPKLSYAAPQPDIFIRRRGYLFHHVAPAANGAAAIRDLNATMLHRLLTSELAQGRRHSRNSLEGAGHGLKRADLRSALDWLIAAGRVEQRLIPDRPSNRGSARYLHPVFASPNLEGEPTQEYPL